MMIQLYHYFFKKIGLTMKSLDVRFDNIRLTIKKIKTRIFDQTISFLTSKT
jgi:hypothetical protein